MLEVVPINDPSDANRARLYWLRDGNTNSTTILMKRICGDTVEE